MLIAQSRKGNKMKVRKLMNIDKERITNILLLMVKNGTVEPIPEGVKLSNYKEMIESSKGKNWTPPTREQVIAAIDATEIEDAKHDQIELVEIDYEREIMSKYSNFDLLRIALGHCTPEERQELDSMFGAAVTKKKSKVEAIKKAKSKDSIKKEKWK
jgi:hypothetical protein